MIYDLESNKLSSEKEGTSPGARVRLKLRPAEKERVTVPRTPDRSTAQ